MSVVLGRAPEPLKIILSQGSDYIAGIRRADAVAWAPTTQLTLDFGTIQWTATLDADLALWDIDQVQVDAVIASRPLEAKLWYVDGGTRLLWAAGPVEVR